VHRGEHMIVDKPWGGFRASSSVVCVTVVVCSILAGCAGRLQIYDSSRDKIAQGAKKSFDSADVAATIAAARENHLTLTEAEVAQARHTIATRRDLLLHAIAGDAGCDPPAPTAATTPATPAAAGTTAQTPRFYAKFLRCIDRELGFLVSVQTADPNEMRRTLRTARATIDRTADALADTRAKFLVLFKGVAPPPCAPEMKPPADPSPALQDAVKKSAPTEAAVLPVFYQNFVDTCGQYLQAYETISTLAGSRDLARAVKDWVDGRSSLAAARMATAEANRSYAQALQAYTEAAVALEKSDSSAARDGFDKAVNRLKAAAKLLEQAGGFFGEQDLAQQRLKDLEALIAGLQGDRLDPTKYDDGLRQAVGTLATLPTFADRTVEIARRRRAPPIGPLILEKDLQQARLTAATRQALRAEQKVGLLERRLSAQIDRTIRLLEARSRLRLAARRAGGDAECTDAVCDQRLPATSVQALASSVPANVRVQLRRALTEYTDSFTINGSEAAEAEYRLIALEYETALDRSEDAVREWQTLIALPIDRLIAYYQSGVRAEEIAKAVAQFLGLAMIGLGLAL
jgi:hypothetical protein